MRVEKHKYNIVFICVACLNTYIFEGNFLYADSAQSELKWLVHSFNVAGQSLAANVVVQHTRVKGQVKGDLQCSEIVAPV